RSRMPQCARMEPARERSAGTHAPPGAGWHGPSRRLRPSLLFMRGQALPAPLAFRIAVRKDPCPVLAESPLAESPLARARFVRARTFASAPAALLDQVKRHVPRPGEMRYADRRVVHDCGRKTYAARGQ